MTEPLAFRGETKKKDEEFVGREFIHTPATGRVTIEKTFLADFLESPYYS